MSLVFYKTQGRVAARLEIEWP